MNKLFLFSALAVCVVSCSKDNERILPDKQQDHIYRFTKTMDVHDESGEASVSLIVSFDNESLTEIINENQFGLSVSYDESPIEDQQNSDNSNDKNYIPNVKVEITKVNLPEGAKAFSLTNKMSKLKSLNEIRYYAYYIADNVSGTRVTFGPNGGQIKVRVGVLWTTSQWFYDNIVTSTLSVYNSYVETNPGATQAFYKMRVRVEIQAVPGTHTVAWIYR